MLNKLSVLVPVYNEEETILKIMNKLFQVKLPCNIPMEVVVVDDGSDDKSNELIERFKNENPGYPLVHKRHSKNIGKGAAIKTGIKNATGDYIIIQDADLEYDPEEFPLMIKPVLDKGADVVYGSRFRGESSRVLYFWHYAGNKFLTLLSNVFTDLNLSDMETCYKLIRKDLVLNMKLEENRFGFEPEVTCKLARIKGIKIYEVGISYAGRTYAEGKKINWKDGCWAIYCILKYSLFRK